MSSKKKISTVITVLLVASLILCGVVTLQVITRGYVSCFGCSFFRVATGSMEPTLPVGTVVLAKNTKIEEISEGEIIVFRSRDSLLKGQTVTHRVVSVIVDETGKTLLETRGDANNSSDGYYVETDNLIGKVIWYNKSGNPFTVMLGVISSRMGFLTCIVFPCLLIAGIVLSYGIKNVKKSINEVLMELDRLEHEQEIKEKSETEVLFTPEEIAEMREKILREILENRELKDSHETGQKDVKEKTE